MVFIVGMEEGVFRPDLDPQIDAGFIREVLMPSADLPHPADVPRLAGATVRFVLAAVGPAALTGR